MYRLPVIHVEFVFNKFGLIKCQNNWSALSQLNILETYQENQFKNNMAIKILMASTPVIDPRWKS